MSNKHPAYRRGPYKTEQRTERIVVLLTPEEKAAFIDTIDGSVSKALRQMLLDYRASKAQPKYDPTNISALAMFAVEGSEYGSVKVSLVDGKICAVFVWRAGDLGMAWRGTPLEWAHAMELQARFQQTRRSQPSQ